MWNLLGRRLQMNADKPACASSGEAEALWGQLSWQECERKVRRLQARIVKATREGRWGKVKALQRLLTHSFAAKALAVDTGERTPEGKSNWMKLVYASDTKIRRY